MSGEDQAEARLRELLRDPRWSLPEGPDPEQRVRRAARRQRLRLAGMAGVAAAAVIAVAIPTGLGTLGQPSRPEQPPAAPTLYIYASTLGSAVNRANVVIPVNTATGTPGKPIHVGAGSAWPQMIVIAPDGKTAYVTTAAGTITPINTATNTPGKPINIGRNPHHDPDYIAVTADGKTAYVIAAGSRTSTLIPISTATNTPGRPIHLGPFSLLPPALQGSQIVFTPEGKSAANTAYVTAGPGLTPIDTATGTPGRPIHLSGGVTGGIAITPDGTTVYALTGSGTVTPISTATNQPGKPIHIRGAEFTQGIAITPDGKTAYVSTVSGCVGGPRSCTLTVTPVSTATGTPGTPIHIGFGPQDCAGLIAITPDGKTAYVTTASGLTPISTATGTPGKPIKLGSSPSRSCYQIVFTPDGRTAYVATGSGVTPISTATGTPGKPINAGEAVAETIAITP